MEADISCHSIQYIVVICALHLQVDGLVLDHIEAGLVVAFPQGAEGLRTRCGLGEAAGSSPYCHSRRIQLHSMSF